MSSRQGSPGFGDGDYGEDHYAANGGVNRKTVRAGVSALREVCETNVRRRVNIGVRYSIWLEVRGAWVEQNRVAYSSVTLTRGKWARTRAKQIAKDWRRAGFNPKLVKITTWRIFHSEDLLK